MSALLGAALVTVLGAGCIDLDRPGPLVPDSLVLGTGSPLFVPIVDGDRVEIIHGPQGGFHINGSLLARGLGDHLRLVFTLTRLDDGWIAPEVDTSVFVMPMTDEVLSLDGGHAGTDGGVFHFVLPPGDGTWGVAPGSRVFIDNPDEIDGRRVRLVVTATADDSRQAQDQRWFIAAMP